LAVLLLFQAILGWNFVSYQLSRGGDDTGTAEKPKMRQSAATRKNKGGKIDAKKKN